MGLNDILSPLLMGQLVLGLVNGAFYALLSLGFAVIFGLLRIVNFTHGAMFMLGAYTAWMLMSWFGIGYWPALLLAPLIAAAIGAVLERFFISRLYKLDHLYGLLLTFGLALVIEGLTINIFGPGGKPYPVPPALTGATNLGFMYLPTYRGWVVVAAIAVSIAIWLLVEKTSLGARLRAATENAALVQAFGVNVPRLLTLTFAGGTALAAFAGVLAAPIYSVNPLMGNSFLVVVFAVVVLGGMGSIAGSIVAGFGLGFIEGLTKYIYPEASSIVIFLAMMLVLLLRPHGLFGRVEPVASAEPVIHQSAKHADQVFFGFTRSETITFALLVAAIVLAPFLVYPVFVMKILCFALFASAFNLLLGYVGFLSLGHAAFFGMGSYLAAWTAKYMGFSAEMAVLSGGAIGVALGLVFGYVAIRRQGLYFAMITFALAQMVYFFSLQAVGFTGGEDGIQEVPRAPFLGLVPLDSDMKSYVFTSAVFLVFFLLLHRVVHSPFGQVLKSIRENEPRAVSLGYKVNLYKLVAFLISAGVAGIAGGMKAMVFGIATLTDVHWSISGVVILMTILGGLGTTFGPIAGAILVVTLQNYLAPLGAWVTVAQGLVFAGCVLALRRGMVGEIASRTKLKL